LALLAATLEPWMLMLSALMSKEDINITGSNIDAQQQLSLNSAKDINIKAGYNGSLNESYHKTSSFSLDVDVFGGATDAIVCLDVNACCIDVVVGIKGNVVATEC
jgi:hypothetical protein